MLGIPRCILERVFNCELMDFGKPIFRFVSILKGDHDPLLAAGDGHFPGKGIL